MTAANSLGIKAIPSFFTILSASPARTWEGKEVSDQWTEALADVSTHACSVRLIVVQWDRGNGCPILHIRKRGTQESFYI